MAVQDQSMADLIAELARVGQEAGKRKREKAARVAALEALLQQVAGDKPAGDGPAAAPDDNDKRRERRA